MFMGIYTIMFSSRVAYSFSQILSVPQCLSPSLFFPILKLPAILILAHASLNAKYIYIYIRGTACMQVVDRPPTLKI